MLNKKQYELIMKAFESHRKQICLKDENTRYKIIDQKLEKYGYNYNQVGYDLFVEKVEK